MKFKKRFRMGDFYFDMEQRLKQNKNILVAETFLFHFRCGSMFKKYTKTL